MGKLVPDSFQRVDGTTLATFSVADQGEALPSVYDGVLPDLFFNPHSDIVLEGSFGDGGVFHTATVIVKCPSKYQARAKGKRPSSPTLQENPLHLRGELAGPLRYPHRGSGWTGGGWPPRS